MKEAATVDHIAAHHVVSQAATPNRKEKKRSNENETDLVKKWVFFWRCMRTMAMVVAAVVATVLDVKFFIEVD